MNRLLLAAALMAAPGIVITGPASALEAPPAQQGGSCAPGAPPPGAATRPVVVNNQPATLWVSTDGFVGVTGYGSVQVPNAGPLPLQALLIDAEQNGTHQLIVSNGRGARLYAVSGCEITAYTDPQGEPFLFDLENLRGNGTGVGCTDLGDGRHLVALRTIMDDTSWTVHRTEIDLDGTTATIGRSDTITAASAQDPAVATANTISCGDQTLDNDGVQQP